MKDFFRIYLCFWHILQVESEEFFYSISSKKSSTYLCHNALTIIRFIYMYLFVIFFTKIITFSSPQLQGRVSASLNPNNVNFRLQKILFLMD